MLSEEKRLVEAGYEKSDVPQGVRYMMRCCDADTGAEIIVTIYKYTKKWTWTEMTGTFFSTPWSVAVSAGVEICFERGKTLDEAMSKAEDKVTSWIASLVEGLKKAQLI